MKFRFNIFIFAILLSLIIEGANPAHAAGFWQTVGLEGISAGEAKYTSLAFDTNGIPFIAYIDIYNSDKATVMKYNGAYWETVGSAGFTFGGANHITLAINNNTPYVAFSDYYLANHATVMKFNGTDWEFVGAAGFSAGMIGDISIAFNNNTPYVAYTDGANSYKATVMKYNSTYAQWETIGTSGFSAGSVPSLSLSLVFDADTPYVAYTDGGNSYKATVMKFNGTYWESVGAAGFSADYAGEPSLAIENGTPYIAFSDRANSDKATVMKFNSANWEILGSAGFSAGMTGYISLAVENGIPYIAYMDFGNSKKATVMKYNGATWETVGNVGFSSGEADFTSMAFYNHKPYVAYQDYANNKKATVMKYNVTTVSSITRASNNPAASGSSVNFTITFSENVTSVDTDGSDFDLVPSGVSAAAITGVTPVSASVYTVSVNTGSGSGTLGLDIPDIASILDLSGNSLDNLPFTGEVYTIQALPAAFRKSAPADGATGQSLSPTLSWGASSGADSYQYCYSSAPGPCSAWFSAGSNTSVTLRGLTSNYTYYWQVRAVNEVGSTEANGGTWWSFTTVNTPACSWNPYTPPSSPTFNDVPMNVAHWSYVQRLYNGGITAGCGNGNFCPGDAVNRASMAIFLLRGKYCGSSYIPPAVGGSTGFNDVATNVTYAPWVKQLAADGVTAGCGNSNFCPGNAVNRASMAIFLLRAKHGGTYSPPGVAGISGFNDVPADASYAPWTKQLAAEGVTAGCGNGNFCPADTVNRAQMAIFLVRAFGLP